MTRMDQRALARAREQLVGIREDEQFRKEMAKMPPTKKKTRTGLMDVPPDVQSLRQAADEAIEELQAAVDSVTSAANRNARLDKAHTVDSRRFPAAAGGES